MDVNIIAAMDQYGLIGRNNKLPWHLPRDLQRFRELTQGHAVIMGRKTFESIGAQPLPERVNIVVSSDTRLDSVNGVHRTSSLAQALISAYEFDVTRAFIIGGAELYAAALPMADMAYITQVIDTTPRQTTFTKQDTRFPRRLLYQHMRLIATESHLPDERNPHTITFEIWKR